MLSCAPLACERPVREKKAPGRPSASESSSALKTGTATGDLTRSTLSISNPLLLTVINIIVKSFAVEVESISIVLTFLSFYLIKEVKVHWIPSRQVTEAESV